MLSKILELDDYFPKTGEPTLRVVARSERGRWYTETAHEKTASEAFDYIKSVTPREGCTIVLVNALGTFEYYDDNRNGDAFPERAYRVGERALCGHEGCNPKGLEGWIAPDEVVTQHYKTFETRGGIYLHHLNKNPQKSLGRVEKAFWNSAMHRVELLLELRNRLDPDLVGRINAGEFPAVSMGCMRAGTRISTGDGRRMAIENVSVGDRVLTHRGRVRRVTELHRRTYVGTIHKIKAEATPEIVCTHEHPFHCVKREDVRTEDGWRQDVSSVRGVWKLAEELDPEKHLLLSPIDRSVQTPDYVDNDFARLLGYYVAEGSVIFDKKGRLYGIDFACHERDELLRELPGICARLGLPAPHVTTRVHSPRARSVIVYHHETAERLALLGGRGAKTKFLDASVMRWHPVYQRELFGAYANGDGCGNKNGSLQVSTASTELADQWLAMLPRFGALASRQAVRHKPNKLVKIETTEHIVFIGAQWAQDLRDVCAKVQPYVVRARKQARRIIGDYVVTPIRGIERTAGTMPVYNFEVEKDESYVVEGLAVHNCNVRWDVCAKCGHRAPTRKDYCEHLRAAMRQVDPATGVKNCALNPSPSFFDISFVWRPADRTGFMLKKVAEEGAYVLRTGASLGEKVAAYEQKRAEVRKLSDLQKEVAGDVEAVRTSPDIQAVRAYRQAVPVAAPLSATNAQIEALAEEPVVDVLSTLASKSAALTTGEFARLFLLKTAGVVPSARLLDRMVALQPSTLALLGRYPKLAEELGAYVRVDPTRISARVETKLAAMGDWLNQRVNQFVDPPAGSGYLSSAREPPRTDLLTMTDPNTGHLYTTNRGAAMRANHEDMKALVGTTLGLSALYGLGLHGASSALGFRSPALSAAGGLALGSLTAPSVLRAARPYRNPQYMTDQGVRVSGGTEFKLASTRLLDKLAADYAERLPASAHRGNMPAALRARTGLGDLPEDYFAPWEKTSFDATEPPDLAVEDFGRVLGTLLLS